METTFNSDLISFGLKNGLDTVTITTQKLTTVNDLHVYHGINYFGPFFADDEYNWFPMIYDTT